MCNLRFILTMLLPVLVAAYDDGEAATIINIAPTGAATYSITATDLPEAAGIDLSISYDTNTLEAPQVKPGELTVGAMMQENVPIPGVLRIAFISSGGIKVSGKPGVLASVTFTKKGTVPAPQPTLSASAYSMSSSQLAVQSTSGAQRLPDVDTTTDGTAKDGTVAGPGTSGGSVMTSSGVMFSTPTQSTTQFESTLGSSSSLQEPGVKNNPFRDDARKEERSEEAVYQNVPVNTDAVERGGAATAGDTSTPVAVTGTKTAGKGPTLKTSQSVLDRFRAYKEIRTMKRLSILFDVSALHAAGIVQSPEIVVTDGKSLVTVAIDLLNDANTPSFSLKGANLKSIRRISDKKWELDALPQKGKSDIRFSIILKGERPEIPLVAVPPLNQADVKLTDLSVASLDALIAKPFKDNKPTYDLNSDGKQDYLDDYILVAHWLLKQQRSGNGADQKPAVVGK